MCSMQVQLGQLLVRNDHCQDFGFRVAIQGWPLNLPLHPSWQGWWHMQGTGQTLSPATMAGVIGAFDASRCRPA